MFGQETEDRFVRWGILSTAKIGVEQVIPAIQKSGNGVLQAIASRDEAKARALAARFQIPHAYAGYEALLADPSIDAVYIPTVTSNHTEWTLKAIAAGKAVLCEKPMGMHADDISAIETAAQSSDIFVAEAYMVAHHPQWHHVRYTLAAGTIGTLKHVDCAFTYSNDDPANMRNIKALGGGALRDVGVYPCVTTLFATGATPRKVSAYVETDPVFETDTYADGHVNFDTFDLRFYVSTQLAPRQTATYHGTLGTIEVTVPFNPFGFGEALVHTRTEGSMKVDTRRFPKVEQYVLQVEQFGRSLMAQEPYPVSFGLSHQVQRIIDACFESNGGKLVKLT